MIQNNNSKNILLITEDNTIIEYIKSIFSDCIIDIYDKDFNKKTKYNLVIIDKLKEYKKIENTIISQSIINISNEKIDNDDIINIKQPFYLKDLLNNIKKILLNDDKILKFKNFKIIDGIIYYQDKEEILGHKEFEIIKYLYKNTSANKDDILNYVWGYCEELETKVFENTINKIRQKFKNIGVDDFIVVNDKEYSINTKYL